MTEPIEAGCVVAGAFWSHSPDARGVGIVVKRGRELWTQVPDDYVPVRVVVGDRARGGYRPADLTVVRDLRPS
jgi:hypothetical protein